MDQITNWVKNIIFLVLITSFLIMFLPDNSMRKYVRVIMGFFIISIFISPFAAVFNQDINSNLSINTQNVMKNNLKDMKYQGKDIKK